MNRRLQFLALLCVLATASALQAQTLPTVFSDPIAEAMSLDRVENFGDHNGDGIDDLLIDIDYVGESTNQIEVLSGRDGNPIRTIQIVSNGMTIPVGRGGFVVVDDINADGVKDYVIAPDAIAALIFGTPIELRSGADDSVIFSFGTSRPQLETLKTVDDISGDGNRDLVAVETNSFTPPNPATEDIVTFYDGMSGAVIQTILLEPNLRISSLDTIGDVDGDLIGDIMLSAASASVQFPQSGGATIISGFDLHRIRNWSGSHAQENFGADSFATDDLDGDGVRDFITLSAESNNGFFEGEEVQAFSAGGLGVGPLYRVFPLPGQEFLRIRRAGDLDGDGFSDFSILVMVPDGTISCTYYEYRSGIDGSFMAAGECSSTDFLGFREGSVGDSNRDGIDEILMLGSFGSGPIDALNSICLSGAQKYGQALFSLAISWEPDSATPMIGNVAVTGGVPNSPLIIGVSAAAVDQSIPGGGHPLYIDTSPGQFILLADAFTNAVGEFRFQESLARPDLAGSSVFFQAAQAAPNLQVTEGLQLLYGP